MSEITPLSTDSTPNPAVITHVRLFVENGNKWIWGQTADGELTTIYWPNRTALAKSIGCPDEDLFAWEYGAKAGGGEVYELPKVLTVSWESKTSANGREYKLPVGVSTGEPAANGKAVGAPTPDLPATALEAQDRLELLAPKLAAAKAEAAQAEAARKTAKAAALQVFERKNFMLLDAENKANERKAELELQARDLIMELAKAGERGHILGGMYQINEKTIMVATEETALLKYLIEHGLHQYLKIDLNALEADLGGKKSPLLPNMPVLWETDKSPQINWSKLATAPVNELAALKTLNVEAEGAAE